MELASGAYVAILPTVLVYACIHYVLDAILRSHSAGTLARWTAVNRLVSALHAAVTTTLAISILSDSAWNHPSRLYHRHEGTLLMAAMRYVCLP